MDNSISEKRHWWSRILALDITEGEAAISRPVIIALILLFLIFLNALIFIGVYLAPYKSLQQMAFNNSNLTAIDSVGIDSASVAKYKTKALGDIDKADKKMATYVPQKPYIVINTTTNTFTLYKGDEIVRKGNCSTGSYVKLKGKGNQEWIFKTPKGYHTVKGKTTDPVWKKPDWAFVEEGLPVPSANHSSRYEYGVLGDYALYMGEGYMIHGTLYQRLLGLPVTHGCIRLGDDDLEAVFKNLGVNSKVFII